MMYKH